MEHTFVPPHSGEAERAVIGSILIDPKAVLPTVISSGCKEDWLFQTQCRTIYRVIESMALATDLIDLVTVCTHPDIVREGLIEFAHHCVDSVVTITHVEHYLDLIKDQYFKRMLISTMREHEGKLCEGDNADEVLTSLMFEMASIDKHTCQKAVRSTDEVMEDIMALYEKCRKQGHVGLPSRWFALQRKTSGYWKKKNTIIAARPGMGKSTFARNEARVWARDGYKVGGLSLEMDTDEVYRLMACEAAGIDSFKFSRGEFTEEELDKFKSALAELMTYPLFIADNVRDIKHVCNWIRRMNRKYDLDAVFIDYIQLIGMEQGKNTRATAVSDVSKALLAVGKECDVSMMVLSQINRGAEPPPNAKPEDRWKYVPRLQHLKESGALEEDAHQAIILYPKPDEYTDSSELLSVPYIFSIEKNRGGPTGKVHTTFRKDLQRFETAGF